MSDDIWLKELRLSKYIAFLSLILVVANVAVHAVTSFFVTVESSKKFTGATILFAYPYLEELFTRGKIAIELLKFIFLLLGAEPIYLSLLLSPISWMPEFNLNI